MPPPKPMRLYGQTWKSDYDNWSTVVDNRFIVLTWKFGSIHQSKIFVTYDHRLEGKPLQSPTFHGDVSICLNPGKTRNEAMKKGLEWVRKFQKKGPDSLAKSIKDAMKHWGDLFPSRIALIDHWFFVIGGGHDWLDGSLVRNSPESHLQRKNYTKEFKKHKKAMEIIKKSVKDKIAQGLLSKEDDYEYARKMCWKTGTYRFYPVSLEYSNICQVPDDVKPEWLALAYEAALLLRDHSGIPNIKSNYISFSADDIVRQEENRKIGAKIVSDLERRFPHVHQKGQ